MKIQRSCCNALIGTEQEQINQLYEIVKALASNYFEGFEIMGTYNTTTNYDKKYMLVFYNGGTYVKTVDGDSINFAPDLHPDKWALFTYPAQGERGPKGEGATVAELAEKIQGSETVVIDENEAGTALEVHLDTEVVNKIDRAILTPNSAPVADRIPYIDFISNAVKYANLNGNIGVTGSGTLSSLSNPVLYRHFISIDINDPDGVEIPIILNIIHYNGLNNKIVSLTEIATFAKLSFIPVVCCIYSGNVSKYNGVATFLYREDDNTIKISGLLGDGTNYSKTINTDDFLISITDKVQGFSFL